MITVSTFLPAPSTAWSRRVLEGKENRSDYPHSSERQLAGRHSPCHCCPLLRLSSECSLVRSQKSGSQLITDRPAAAVGSGQSGVGSSGFDFFRPQRPACLGPRKTNLKAMGYKFKSIGFSGRCHPLPRPMQQRQTQLVFTCSRSCYLRSLLIEKALIG